MGYYDQQPHTTVWGCARQGGHHIYPCNVYDETAIKKMLFDIAGVDILINNAGVASMNAFTLTPTATMADILATNLVGTMIMCREVSKKMITQHYGRVINISTVAVPLALAGEAVYVASKAGVEALTRVLAKELYGYGITVNCVAPTIVDVGGLASGVPKEKVRELLDKTATKEPCSVEDIARVIDFFIDSPRVTGQTVYIGGV